MKFFNRKKKAPPEEKVPTDKAWLKLARLYIDENNLKEALKCCKKVLRKNNQNYMALVLFARALDGSEYAVPNYEKALKIRPENPLAWQGLANYYERKKSIPIKIKLLAVYEKILTLPIEEEYAMKTLKKYGQISCFLSHSNSISTFIKYMSVQRTEILMNTAERQLLEILHSGISCKNEDISAAIQIMKNFINRNPHEDNTKILICKLILQDNEFAEGIKEIIKLELFSSEVIIREWVCQQLCNTFIENEDLGGFDIDNYIDELTKEIEDTTYGGTLVAIMHYRNGNYMEAYQKCATSLRSTTLTQIPEATFMLNCAKMIKDLTLTENLSGTFLKKPQLNNPDFVLTVYKTLISAYIEHKNCYEAISVLKKYPIEKMDSVMLMELGNLYMDSNVNDGIIIKILDSTDYLELFKIYSCLKRGKFSQAILALRSYDKHPLKYYHLGHISWRIGQYRDCLMNLKKAVELIPNNPKVYYSLALYYYQYEKNIEEGRKYFEKSYKLCKTDIDVIRNLSVIYDQLNLMDLEYDLLKNSINITKTKQFWICTRLGRLCFAKGDMEDAIVYLQQGIELNPRDVTAHEWLGDAYLRSKIYDRALAAYEKVVELSNDTPLLINCFYRIGSIYTEQKLHDQAVIIYDNILQVEPDNVQALKGITKNRLIIGQKHFSEYAFIAAREEVQLAVNRITKAMSNGITSTTYWHLFGDAMVFISRLPNEYCYINLQSTEGETIRRGKIPVYEMAIESYSNVAKLRDSFALFKCAYIYLQYYFETKRLAYRHTSYNLAVLCVKINSNSWRYWDMLGKVCYFSQKYEVAHYCFFKAISLNEESSVSTVWCNLGALYLKIDKERLANYCFAVGRESLPPYSQAWVGDGLLAEIIQEDGNIRVFNPGPNSNFEQLSDTDYLDWVSVINQLAIQPNDPAFNSPIEAFRFIPNAIDIIEWYLSFEQETAWGCCSLGHIQENKGLFSGALSYYQRAYAMADNELKNELLLHKARVLIKMRQYDEAINVYNGVDGVNLQGICTLAYALFKGGNYEESYIAYDKALSEYCTNDSQRIKVLMAMANAAYRLNGLHDGVALLHRAEEIKRSSDGHGFDLPFLKSYAFGKVEIELVGHIMAEYLHVNADNGMWWYYMGLNYLRDTNKKAKMASSCIQRAIDLVLNTEHSGEIGKMHAMVSIAEFYAGDKDKAMEYAKRGIIVYPGQQELWAALILCVYSHREWPHRVAWVITALYQVRQNIPLTRPISAWLKFLEEKLIANE